MIAVVLSLVAIVLAVVAVVAMGMRSMNRRESSLPPERLKQMAEKEEQTHARSTDEFAAHEPRMANFSPDFSPIDAPKPKPVRTGQRGKRGVDEWGNPRSDDDDEEFWASIRSDATEGGFGAGGTVAARKGASRPVDDDDRPSRADDRPARAGDGPSRAGDRPARADDRPARAGDRTGERPALRSVERQRPERERTAERQRPERPAERRRPPRREPVAAVDPDAATVQAPLPQRPLRAVPPPSAGLADLVEPAPRPAPSASDLADQRTVTFAAPTPDVMSVLRGGGQLGSPGRPESLSSSGSFPAAGGPRPVTGSGPIPAGPRAAAGVPPESGAFSAASSGAFPVAPVTPLHGAPISDPFPTAYQDTAETTWPRAASGSWPAAPVADILDDDAPSVGGSWPASPAVSPSRASYEVSNGWAVADDSEPLTGPSPATGVPTAPARAVARDDVFSAPSVPGPPVPPAPMGMSIAYETGDITIVPPSEVPWPQPPANSSNWPSYSEMYGGDPEQPRPPQGGDPRDPRVRRGQEHDFPDYYR
jgi:hypothetical protein